MRPTGNRRMRTQTLLRKHLLNPSLKSRRRQVRKQQSKQRNRMLSMSSRKKLMNWRWRQHRKRHRRWRRQELLLNRQQTNLQRNLPLRLQKQHQPNRK